MREAKPVLKWAGGKTQLLSALLPKIPAFCGRYIEPFFGGGALFFALRPENAVIADSNPELINVYRQIARDVGAVIGYLEQYENTEEMFYTVRSQDWTALPAPQAAARTLYLNRTCFNGLYRINRRGQFNVPYGRYKNPTLCDRDALYAAGAALQSADILCSDYAPILELYAQEGDFIFLDPPYLALPESSGFGRYTKKPFGQKEHIALAETVSRLHKRGCHILFTSAVHPLICELYAPFQMETVKARRSISRNSGGRTGSDLIISIPPAAETKKEAGS